MGTIIWLIGTVLAIMAVMDVFKKNISIGWKSSGLYCFL